MNTVTIVTICYNEKNKLIKTIESVLRQTYTNIEYLIIDGASTDGTIELLKKYFKYEKVVIYSEKDTGIYNAMNKGILKARGKYILFLNAGDFLYNDYVIEQVMSYIKEIDNIIYYGKTCLTYADGLVQIEDFSSWEGSLKDKVFNGMMPCHQSIFAPRKILLEHLFDEKYKIRADYEWLLYSICAGYDCINIPIIISNFDLKGISSRLKNRKLFEKEELDILEKYSDNITEDILLFKKKLISEQKEKAIKYNLLFQIMNHWLSLKHNKINIGKFLKEKGYKNVGIYGMSHMGLRLLEELRESELTVKYVIDKNISNICIDIKKVSIEEELEAVDVIIVTAISEFNEIKNTLEDKLECSIISLEDLIYDIEY